jgi:hypothetical protein
MSKKIFIFFLFFFGVSKLRDDELFEKGYAGSRRVDLIRPIICFIQFPHKKKTMN